MKRVFKLAAVFCWVFLMTERSAFAYLDPGTGSMVLQLLLGGIAGLVVVVKLNWHSLLSFLRISHQSDAVEERQDQQGDSDEQKSGQRG